MNNVQLIRTKRKTLGIYIRPDGTVEVRAPLRLPQRDIEHFVQEKAAWITEKQQLVQQRQANALPLTPELEKQCRKQAKAILPGRVAHFAAIMGVQPTAMRITGATTRWGSCSSKGSVNFSWRLMLCDDDVIDYVVVHELAHLREMNHSPRFWAIVAGVLPDYKRRKAKLSKQPALLGNR